MYFIVGKTINQNRQVMTYLITSEEGIKEVTPQQVYVEYQKGNLPYLKGIDSNTGEVDFKNIDNSLIPTFYDGRGINNSVSVLKIVEENNDQTWVRILGTSGQFYYVSLADIIKLVNDKKIKLFNAKIVNGKIVMKYKDMFIIINKVLVKYTGNVDKVKIPNGVVSIGNKAFRYSHRLKSVVIPDSVKSIGDSAFACCKDLVSVKIPDGVKSIGDNAFTYCTSIVSVSIPNSVKSIGDNAFAFCRNLVSVKIPDGVTSIGKKAFAYCTSITSVSISDSVTSIGDKAFLGCENLTDLIIGDGITSIGEVDICDCNIKNISIGKALTTLSKSLFRNSVNIKVDPENKYFCAKNNIVYSKDGKTLLLCARRKEGEVIIPDGVETIGECAFKGCYKVTSIHMPNSVTSIEKYAFYGCIGLTSIDIAESVEKIEEGVFGYLNLVSIKIPSSVKSIGKEAFIHCSKLEEVIIGDNTSIGDGAFDECYGLADDKGFVIVNNTLFGYFGTDEEVVIPEGVKYIDYGAFWSCDSMKFLTIPSSVTSIGDGVCYGRSDLSGIKIPDGH